MNSLTIAKAITGSNKLEEMSTVSLWRLAQTLEDLAFRSEDKGEDSTTLRRVAVRVGEIALARR